MLLRVKGGGGCFMESHGDNQCPPGYIFTSSYYYHSPLKKGEVKLKRKLKEMDKLAQIHPLVCTLPHTLMELLFCATH